MCVCGGVCWWDGPPRRIKGEGGGKEPGRRTRWRWPRRTPPSSQTLRAAPRARAPPASGAARHHHPGRRAARHPDARPRSVRSAARRAAARTRAGRADRGPAAASWRRVLRLVQPPLALSSCAPPLSSARGMGCRAGVRARTLARHQALRAAGARRTARSTAPDRSEPSRPRSAIATAPGRRRWPCAAAPPTPASLKPPRVARTAAPPPRIPHSARARRARGGADRDDLGVLLGVGHDRHGVVVLRRPADHRRPACAPPPPPPPRSADRSPLAAAAYPVSPTRAEPRGRASRGRAPPPAVQRAPRGYQDVGCAG